MPILLKERKWRAIRYKYVINRNRSDTYLVKLHRNKHGAVVAHGNVEGEHNAKQDKGYPLTARDHRAFVRRKEEVDDRA